MTNGAPENGVPESEDCLTVQITANQAAITGLALNAFYDSNLNLANYCHLMTVAEKN